MSRPMPDPPLDFQAFYQRYHRVYLRYAHLHLRERKAAIETVESVFVQLLETWSDVLTQPRVHRYAHSVLRRTLARRAVPVRLELPHVRREGLPLGAVRAGHSDLLDDVLSGRHVVGWV
ncbi:hypothetical protein ABZ027_04105 [Streptomyces sp. NPDC006332]|uniref:hypothetical protein n=1 Tax=Streptomyces sp. NPDC006332 TaxID=3155456 RepID=UPI00339F29CA